MKSRKVEEIQMIRSDGGRNGCRFFSNVIKIAPVKKFAPPFVEIRDHGRSNRNGHEADSSGLPRCSANRWRRNAALPYPSDLTRGKGGPRSG
jgi:hypothetical protein